MCFWAETVDCVTGVVEGEGEEEGDGEWLAQREGRRRLAGRAGLEKVFWTDSDEDVSWLSCKVKIQLHEAFIQNS